MLLTCESFDIYSTTWLAQRFAVVTGSPTIAANGRTGTNAFNCATSGGTLTNVTLKGISEATFPVTVYAGTAIQIPTGFFTNVGQYICPWIIGAAQWAGGAGIAPRIKGDGSIVDPYTGGSASSGTFSFNVWHYLEIAVIVSAYSGGSQTIEVTMWLDDIQILDATTTTGTAFPTMTAVNYGICTVGASSGNPAGTVLFDDMVFYDNQGSFFNTRTGDVDVFEQMPNGPGRITGVWTNNGGGGTQNWQNVDEIPPDSDTSYITDATPGDEECFTLTANPVPGAQVLGMMVTLTAKKTSASGLRTIAGGLGNGSAEGFGTAQALTSSYSMYLYPFSNDPITSGAFDPNAAYQAAVETVT